MTLRPPFARGSARASNPSSRYVGLGSATTIRSGPGATSSRFSKGITRSTRSLPNTVASRSWCRIAMEPPSAWRACRSRTHSDGSQRWARGRLRTEAPGTRGGVGRERVGRVALAACGESQRDCQPATHHRVTREAAEDWETGHRRQSRRPSTDPARLRGGLVRGPCGCRRAARRGRARCGWRP